MIKPVTFQGCFNFNANLYALEVRSRFIDQSKANGYYKGYGNELAAQIVGQKIQIGTGAFLVQGRMCEITAAELVAPQIFDGFVGYVVARIETYHPSDDANCSLLAVVNRTYEAITLEQNDTYAATADNVNTAYELPLYSFEISGTSIVNLKKLINPVADYATIKTIVDEALEKAASAVAAANTAISTANAANTKSDDAVAKATDAVSKAANAVSAANAANTKSDNAVETANSAKSTAETVKGIAESADTKAGNAETVAAGAVITANGAKTKAEDAVSKAETAIETANGADTKADSATEVASAANTKSDNAVSAANEAKQTASDAANLASTTKTQVEQKVNELEEQIGTKQGTTVTVDGVAQATFEGGGLIDESDTIILGGGEA